MTENGFGLRQSPNEHGFVDDSDRIAFLSSYLAAMHEAIRLGCDVRGWFVWTLLNGFEWIDGFEKRFGLVRVEPEALRRCPKHPSPSCVACSAPTLFENGRPSR